jgi:hypothetical protein
MKRFAIPLFLTLAFCLPAHAATPDHVLASVKIGGCSGTVFTRGPVWSAIVSCRHCYAGQPIGGHYWVYLPDGSQNSCTLVASDPINDLTLFRIPTDATLGCASLPERMPAEVGEYCSVGYPQGQGPFYHVIVPHRTVHSIGGVSERWGFACTDGISVGGQSGSGVFADGRFVGVQSHRNTVGTIDTKHLATPRRTGQVEVGDVVYSCQHRHLVEFVKAHRSKIADCGPIFEDRPIAEKPTPLSGETIRSKVRKLDCSGGRCRLRTAELEAQAPPEPRRGNSQRWTPSPNIQIDVDHSPSPLEENPPEEQLRSDVPEYDGHGRPPEGYRKPRERSKRILDLERREPLQGNKGERGEPGAPGQDLRPTPPTGSFMPALFSVFAAIAIGKVLGYRHGY